MDFRDSTDSKTDSMDSMDTNMFGGYILSGVMFKVRLGWIGLCLRPNQAGLGSVLDPGCILTTELALVPNWARLDNHFFQIGLLWVVFFLKLGQALKSRPEIQLRNFRAVLGSVHPC